MKWTFFEWGKTYYGQKQADKCVRLEQGYLDLRNKAAFEVLSTIWPSKRRKNGSAAKQALTAARKAYAWPRPTL